jgi:hypothetical protein
MPSASAHLDHFADFLEQQFTPFTDEPDIRVDPWDEYGTLVGRLQFPDGCELHVRLVVDCSRINQEEWAAYSFHCQDAAHRCVVRFDNAPHHRWVRTFPDHIHRGPSETVGPHPRPTGREIVREVLSHHDRHGLA